MLNLHSPSHNWCRLSTRTLSICLHDDVFWEAGSCEVATFTGQVILPAKSLLSRKKDFIESWSNESQMNMILWLNLSSIIWYENRSQVQGNLTGSLNRITSLVDVLLAAYSLRDVSSFQNSELRFGKAFFQLPFVPGSTTVHWIFRVASWIHLWISNCPLSLLGSFLDPPLDQQLPIESFRKLPGSTSGSATAHWAF